MTRIGDRGVVTFALLAALAGCGSPRAPDAVAASASSGSAVAPAPRPALVDDPTALSASYITPYANSRRNSRVELPTFVPTELRQTSLIVRAPPDIVIVSPEGKHVLVGGGASADRYPEEPSEQATVCGRMLLADGEWRGQYFLPYGEEPSKVLRYLDGFGPQCSWTDGHGGFRTVTGRISDPLDVLHLSGPPDNVIFPRGGTVEPGPAFIEEDGRVVIVSASSVDFYATGQDDKHTPISFGPGVQVYLVSGTSAGIALLAEDRRSHLTTLRVLDESGVERWRSDVRTTPSQPPIDGGPDRIYVAGSALFAFEDRREIWHLDDGPMIRATAFADGGLAIARGTRLLILDRDGKELGHLTTPDTDLLVTPPALASDGSIWVASATHLYVAR